MASQTGTCDDSVTKRIVDSYRIGIDAFWASSGVVGMYEGLLCRPDHTSWKTQYELYVPQTRRHEKNVAIKAMPLYNWSLEPVRPSLSQNQCMLRKGDDSSHRMKVVL